MWITPSGREAGSVEKLWERMRASPGDFSVLEKVPLNPDSVPAVLDPDSDGDGTVVFLDTETTGTDPGSADVIELGMVRCRYDTASGRVAAVTDVYDQFDDPGVPIPEEVTDLTGITDDMVRGRRIDERAVGDWLGRDPLIVAHNAAFDRPIFERRFPGLDSHRWACSMEGVDWYGMGYGTRRLSLLLQQEGWFFPSHRAHHDCFATAWIMHAVPEAFGSLLESLDFIKVAVSTNAFNNTYRAKEDLKRAGYRWDAGARTWSRSIPKGEVRAEREFLRGLNLEGEYKDARAKFKLGA